MEEVEAGAAVEEVDIRVRDMRVPGLEERQGGEVESGERKVILARVEVGSRL